MQHRPYTHLGRCRRQWQRRSTQKQRNLGCKDGHDHFHHKRNRDQPSGQTRYQQQTAHDFQAGDENGGFMGVGLKVHDSLDEDGAIEPETTETPELLLLASADGETIQKALEQLPVKFREVILLCDVEEMSYQEIGQTLAIPIGTVMSRLSRARRAMRVLLAACVERPAS